MGECYATSDFAIFTKKDIENLMDYTDKIIKSFLIEDVPQAVPSVINK